MNRRKQRHEFDDMDDDIQFLGGPRGVASDRDVFANHQDECDDDEIRYDGQSEKRGLGARKRAVLAALDRSCPHSPNCAVPRILRMNHITISAAFSALLLVGCASNEAQRKQDDEVSWARASVRIAQANNTVTCAAAEPCLKAWQLAKAYAQQNTDMRFQFSDDTTASTYAPIDAERVGIRLLKTPAAGASSEIQIVAVCKGFDSDVASWVVTCSKRLKGIYDGFRPYVEAKL